MAALSDTVIKILVVLVRRYLYTGRLALNGQKGIVIVPA